MRNKKAVQTRANPQCMRAIPYLRVSTDQQAQEGVSLDAQRAKVQAYCVAHDLEIVEIIVDEGKTAKTLERPGLQRALRMLTDGQAEAIVVVKLDRLTRSVKDLGFLCDTYFREGMPYYLLSVGDSIDTRSAGGKLVLNVLMSVAQWEREAISERTQEAMNELKRQGVALGRPPYGWRYSDETDAQGRRMMVETPDAQRGIKRICELYDADMLVKDICATLDAEGVPSPSRRKKWTRPNIYYVLNRAGYKDPKRRRKSALSWREVREAAGKAIRDKSVAAARASELRAQGLSLRQIAASLHKARILPPRANTWQAAGVLDLLRSVEKLRNAA